MAQKVKFGKFVFYQSEFKISSDNVLFFEFVRLPKRGLAVELGAGFGLGTVILAKRYPQTQIVAVEYQRELFELLKLNLGINSASNVKPILCDIRGIERCLNPQTADVVYSNPPFWREEFLSEETKKGEVYIKANYEVETKYTDFVRAAKYLLKSSKDFYLMMDTPRMFEVLKTLEGFKFQPLELKLVFPNDKKPSHVFFVKSRLGGKRGHLKVYHYTYSQSY